MSRDNRCDHMRTLRCNNALPCCNILRLTLPHTDVVAQLAAISSASAKVLKEKYYLTASTRIIEGHWNSAKTSIVDQKCLATLAVFSAATSGQYILGETILTDALIDRRSRDGVSDAEMGEEALEAKGMGKKNKEVDALTRRMGKASVPDKMPDSDEDEDAVSKPGRIRGG
jgi:DNA-binding FrmR family transcriptional regulator